MVMPIKKLVDNAVIPTKGSLDAAGYDLVSLETGWIRPHERKVFKTGIAIAIPQGYYGRIAPRSGLAVKQGVDTLAGVIDSDYRGEILVVLLNTSDGDETNSVQISIGQKIAQIIIEKYEDVYWQLEDNLPETVRANGGFGSSDAPKSSPTI